MDRVNAAMRDVDARVIADLAPLGCIRVALNLGNAALVKRDALTSEFTGISVDLARALARELNTPLQLHPFAAAGQMLEALHADVWDVAFLALDPTRRKQLAFTNPYLLIEGRYLVREHSPLRCVDDLDTHLDQGRLRIAVTAGTAYDRYLTHHLKAAQLCRFATSQHAFAAFCEQDLSALAGVKEVLLNFMAHHGGLRLIDPAFMVIEQAMAIPVARSAGTQYLADFINRHTANGFVATALARHGMNQPVATNSVAAVLR